MKDKSETGPALSLAGGAPVTEVLSNWVADFDAAAIATEVRERARLHLADTLAATLAGSQLDVPRLVIERLLARSRSGRGTLIGHAAQLDSEDCALCNGVSAHILDIDDQSYSLMGHPSAVVLPATLAAAEEAGSSGRELLDAFIIGVEVACKVGEALNPTQFQAGWHSTATVGAFGASAGSTRIWHLEAASVAAALGFVPVIAGGVRANNGTEAKCYQVGQAAHAGLVSANLARSGLRASPVILEGRDGFAQTSNRGNLSPYPIMRLGEPFEFIEPGIMIKTYPACSALGSVIDAAKELISCCRSSLDEIVKIECRVTPIGFASLPYRIPATPLQGKFSAPFCIAAALIDGNVDEATFTAGKIGDQRIVRLAERVSLISDGSEDFAPKGRPEGATLTVTFADGRLVSVKTDQPVGGPARPLSAELVYAKFDRCCSPVLGHRTGPLFEMIMNIDRIASVSAFRDFLT